MSIERIKDLIIDSAKKKADEIIEATKKDLEKELNEFKDSLNEEYKVRLEKSKKEIDEEVSRIKAVEISKIEKERLLKKKKILDEFFEKLKSTLIEDEKSYLNFLLSLLRRDLVDGATISLNSNDLKKYKKELEKFVVHELKLKDVKISNEPIDIFGGVVIRTSIFEVDDSIDAIVNAFREEKEIEIAKEIFG